MDEDRLYRQQILIRILSIAIILLLGVVVILFVKSRAEETITVGRANPTAPSGALTVASSAVSSTDQAQPRSQNASYFSYPYPLAWNEGADKFDLTGATLGEIGATGDIMNASTGQPYPAGAKIYALTLILKISTGANSASCLPINMRRVVNEEGDLAQPDTTSYDFPDVRGGSLRGYCPAPNSIFDNQKIIFAVSGDERQYTLTTGNGTNIFFFVTAEDDGTLKIEKAPTSENG
jgi:hypothetical protein